MMGISGITPNSSISKINPYNNYVQKYQGMQDTKAAQQVSQPAEGGMKIQLTGTPKAPVQPVRPIGAPTPHTPEGIDAAQKLRQGADPAELAVRMRIQRDYPEAEQQALLPGDRKSVV